MRPINEKAGETLPGAYDFSVGIIPIRARSKNGEYEEDTNHIFFLLLYV